METKLNTYECCKVSFIQWYRTTLFFLFLFIFNFSISAQDLTYTTSDILSSVTDGSTSATITKSGTTLTITKTGGGTSPLNATYPTGAPINTLPVDFSASNIEGLHLGRTWGTNGTGWVDSYGQLRNEVYSFGFSEQLVKFKFSIGALNNNTDGIEEFRISDVLDGGVSVLDSVSFSIFTEYDDPNSDSLFFDATTRDIQVMHPDSANGWNESSIMTIASSVPFDEIIFERIDYENNRADKNVGGANYTNGVSMTNFELYFPELAPLPVDLVHFSVNYEETDVNVSWATYSETNNKGFYIQWKTDDSAWETLTFVDGVGNSSQINFYNYLHRNPPLGSTYYRLIQEDFDGKRKYSSVINLNNKNGQSIKVHTNPLNNQLWVTLKEKSDVKVSVLNMSGTIIFQANEIEQNILHMFQTPQLSSGIYIVSVIAGNYSKTVKIIRR